MVIPRHLVEELDGIIPSFIVRMGEYQFSFLLKNYFYDCIILCYPTLVTYSLDFSIWVYGKSYM